MSKEDLRTNPSDTAETRSTEAGGVPGLEARDATLTPDRPPVAQTPE